MNKDFFTLKSSMKLIPTNIKFTFQKYLYSVKINKNGENLKSLMAHPVDSSSDFPRS